MKITPFYLFLILLIILVVSVIFGKKNNFLFKENFISFEETATIGESIIIPTYSSGNNVFKLYDNLFFDMKNGNLIEIDSPKYDNNLDTTENSILNTIVTTRTDSNPSTSYEGNIAKNVFESKINVISDTYISYSYHTVCKNTDNYIVIYIPWKKETIIHLLNVTSNTHVATYGCKDTITYFSYSVDDNNNPNDSIALDKVTIDNNTNNNTGVYDNYYDPKKLLYQISEYVKFDIK